MATARESIDDQLADWLVSQPVFVVATAPLSGDGLVNASPKGGAGSFAVLGPTTVAYRELTGSGVETIAHLQENGRIVLMFMSFDRRPDIIRLHGAGRALLPGDPEFGEHESRFSPHIGTRAIIVVELARISSSCGYGVPLMEFVGDRLVLDQFTEKRGPDGIRQYWADHNRTSLDGLPGIS